MTAQEMRFAVLLKIDSIFANAAPGYNNLQMEYFLNNAQRRVFNEKKKLYDSDETVKRMLSPLNRRASLDGGTIAAGTAAVTGYEHPNGMYYSLPIDVAYITEEFVRFTSGQTVTDPVLVLPITYDYYVKNYNNRYKRPYAGLVWRLDYKLDSVGSNPTTTPYTVELITDGVNTIEDYQISYIKFPANMTIGSANCEVIDQNFHDEIVSEAVKMITASLNDEGYQVAMNETTFDK